MRLDQYCAQFWPEYSRSTWQKFIAAGYVKVNGEVITAPKKPLDEDDAVTVNVPENPNFENETLPILYEDDDVIVINKPAGVLTHPKGTIIDEFSVAEFMKNHSDFEDSDRPGIVHRLDRDTSGVIIAAKNQAALSFLAKQFADRKAKKTYLAVLDGIPKHSEAEIDLPIGRNPRAPSTFRVVADGKSAQTTYRVLATNDSHQSLVELKPLTGRTHQLRVHTAYMNTPILGDRVYGKEADRLYLHARDLEITLPHRERKTFTAPVPESFLDKFPNYE